MNRKNKYLTMACAPPNDLPSVGAANRRGIAARALAALLLLLPLPALAGLGASVTLDAGQPTDIYPGEITAIRITLSNNDPNGPVTSVAFSNSLPGTLPNRLKIAGAASYTCTDPATGNPVAVAGTLTAALNTQAISLSGGSIPARDGASSTDGSCDIVIPVTAGTTDGAAVTYTYTVANGGVTGIDSSSLAVANSGEVSQSINVRALAQPTISKSFANSTLFLGGNPATLTIQVANTNPVAIANFSINDAFPTAGGGAIIQVAAAPNPVTDCGSAFAPVAGSTSISTSGGTLPANGSCTFQVDVEARQTNGAYSVSLTNTIDASNDFGNDLGIRAAANASAPVTARSPLRMAKSFAHSALAGGQSDTLTITLYNDGNADLTVSSFTDDPIDGIGNSAFGLTPGSVSTTCAGGVTSLVDPGGAGRNTGIRLVGGTIPAGGSCALTVGFSATPQAAGVPISYTNTIPEGGVDVGDAAIFSQATSASLLVADGLRVLKSASPATVAPGEPVRYTVSVQNYGSSAITGVTVSDDLTNPANGLTFLTGAIGANDYTPSLAGAGCTNLAVTGSTGATNPTFTFDMPGRVNPNTPAQCAVTFYAMADPNAANGSSTTNTINAGDVCYNGGATCNGNSASAGGAVDTTLLSAVKTFDDGTSQTLSEGTVSTLRIVVSNDSANPLTNLSISDTLPAATTGSGQLRIADPANAASDCGTPTITATPGTTSLSLNGGTVPARASNGTGATGSCFIQVDVVGGAGIYNNTATLDASGSHANGVAQTVGPVNSNTAILTYTSSLSASKSFSPAAVTSGGKATATIRLNNTGAQALANVSLTDPLPAGMTVASPANAYTTCAGSTSVSAIAGGNSIGLSGASIAGGGNCDLLFDVVAVGGANWVNTIPAGNITANGGVANQTAVSGTLNYVAPSGLTVAKATNPSTLTFPGEVSRLTITVTAGTQPVSGLSLTDWFTDDGTAGGTPNGMLVASTPAASTTCSGATVSALTGATSVGLVGGSLAANTSCTITVNVTSSAVGGVTNLIPPGAISTDQGLSNAGQASTSLTTQGNVGITKQFIPDVIKPGARSRLRLTFYNPVSQPMSDLAVTDTLPAGVLIPAGPNSVTDCTGASITVPASNQVAVSGGSLPAASGGAAATCYAEIDVTAAAQGDYTNTISTGDLTGIIGGVPVNNSQPASAILRVRSPLEIHEAFSSRTLDPGDPVGFTTGTASSLPGTPVTLTITLVNPNNSALTGAALIDSLPSGLVVATTPNAGTTCGGSVTAAASGTSVALTGGTIPANASCSVTVDVLSNIPGTYTDQIPGATLSTLEGVSNEEPTSARLVIAEPPSVAKQFLPPVIASGDTSRLTIVLGNDNSTVATLSSALVDTLPTAPGSMQIATPPNLSKTCPGAVTANAGSGSVTYASGATIPAGGCEISVDVTASAAGDYSNNIPAGGLVTDLGNNQQPANALLKVGTQGFISGRVFKDNNVTPNGGYDAGTDTPIEGVSIELHNGVDCSGTLLASTTTDALGNYLFSGLAAGTYSVCEPVAPTGTLNGATTAGPISPVNGSTGSPGTASNPTANTSQVAAIVLNGDGAGGEVSGTSGNDFAEIAPSTISGSVFKDQNNNGTQNGADTGLSGVAIELSGTDYLGNPVSLSTTTGADGGYSFSGLLPGNYTVSEPNQPAGTANGITTAGAVANGGTAGSAAAVTTLPSAIANIVLPPNTTASGNDFAELPGGRTLSGRVFVDFNNNGTLDGSDHGLSGQVINLSGTDINGNPVTATTTTDSDGSYVFSGLPAGTYTVDQPSQPPGTSNGTATAGSTGGVASNPGVTSSRISGIDLTGGNTVSANNNFAEQSSGSPDLAIAKTHSPASFGEGGSTGVYTITPSNIGAAATSGALTVVDTLPVGLTPLSAGGSGWSCSIAGQTVSCSNSAVISAGTAGNAITVRTRVAAGLAGQILINTASITGGGEPSGLSGNNSASDPTPIATPAKVSGHVWRDLDHDRVLDAGEPLLADWEVELLFGGQVVASASTDANGAYRITGVSPGSGYSLRFREPTTGTLFGLPATNEQGIAPAPGTRDTGSGTANNGSNAGNPAGATPGDGILQGMTLLSGDNVVEQSLPLDPAGVIYDSVTRSPVAGAVVSISGPPGFNAADVVGGSLNQTTGASGLYQFLLLNTAPAGTYTLTVTAPGGYLPAPSVLIPPCTPTLSVTALPDPALVQNSATAPAAGTPNQNPATCPATSGGLAASANTTQYYYSFVLTPGVSGDVVNNHIPIDPVLEGAIVMTKTTPLVNVSRGDLVPYTVTGTNTLSAALADIAIRDRIPPGFRYRAGSATLNGAATEPAVSGRDLTWNGQSFTAGEVKTFKLLLVVGAGVADGKYENRAWALQTVVNTRVSNIASATVRVVPDPTFDCSDIIGKVFDDRNANGYQDQGEPGIPNVRIATVRGLLVTTDADGRFHVACADIPQRDIGSNFIMKLDARTLPSGYRITTENPRVVRTTRGKIVKLNFGAAIHKVFRLEVTWDAFVAGGRTLHDEWAGQLKQLMRLLEERPSVLRIAYLAGGDERTDDAQARLEALTSLVRERYREAERRHEEDRERPPLVIETELVPAGSADR